MHPWLHFLPRSNLEQIDLQGHVLKLILTLGLDNRSTFCVSEEAMPNIFKKRRACWIVPMAQIEVSTISRMHTHIYWWTNLKVSSFANYYIYLCMHVCMYLFIYWVQAFFMLPQHNHLDLTITRTDFVRKKWCI